MHPILRRFPSAAFRTGLLAAALAVAACHGSNTTATSGAGVAWVTLGTVPNPIFTSYVVTVDSVSVTDESGNTYTALSTPEPVDLVKLRDVREIWGSGTIPNDNYKAVSITIDYTNAAIFVLVNGVPQRAAVVGPSGVAVTTQQVTVNLDPGQPLVITPSYSTDNAQLLALNFDLLASNSVDLATSPATVTVSPFLTVALAPPDHELIRVRGPLVNSSVPLNTYTVYERPFYDQASAIGELTIFNDNSTIYTLDGASYQGAAGFSALAQLPAGVTVAETYTTFEPTATTTAFAGKFNSVYVVAGSSAQSTLTENLSGDVIAISTDASTGVETLTLRGATVYGPLVALQQGYFGYQTSDATLLIGPGTVVTEDDSPTTAGLTYKSVAVGDHVEAVGNSYTCVGICGTSGLGAWTIDATAAATGKVRLQQTPVYGTLQAEAAGSLTVALQTINYWPVADFNFAGNGSTPANTPNPAAFSVSLPGGNTLGGFAQGTPVFASGLANGFGQAPPDFIAATVTIGSGVPATLHAEWTEGGTLTPFASLTTQGFQIDLQNPHLANAVLQAGSLSIPLNTLAASPQIVATSTPLSIVGQPIFSPHYAYSTVASVEAVALPNVSVFTRFAAFVPSFVSAISAASPAYELTASGTYDEVSNQFIANTVSVVL